MSQTIPPMAAFATALSASTLGPLAAVRPILADYAGGAVSADDARAVLEPHLPPLRNLGVLPTRVAALERFVGGFDYRLDEARAFTADIDLLQGLCRILGAPDRHGEGTASPRQAFLEGVARLFGFEAGGAVSRRTASLAPPRSLPAATEERIICPHCDADNLKDSNYCRCCRGELAESPHLKAPERRFCTILFIDYKGFTAASESLPAGLLGDIINRHAKALGSIIVRHGGRIIKPTGDGLFAVWGTARSTEDDAVNAVKAALRMQREIERLGEALRREGHPSFKMRIGVNSGDVWVGHIEGPGVHWFDVLGKAVNRAARAESEAPVGGVLILEPTRQELLRRGDPIEIAPEGVLKGKREGELTEEIATYVALRIRPEEETSEDRPSLIRELVGRERELGDLSAAYLRAVASSRAEAVLLTGEAGMGKSRLERAFREDLERASPQPLKLRVRADDVERKVPYRAVMDIVRRAARVHAEDPAETVLARLSEFLTPSDLDLHLLGNLLGHAFENAPEDLHFFLNDPAALRERTLEAVTALFRKLLDRSPVLMILEDLHWMDHGSLEFLEDLLARLAESPLFVLGLSRAGGFAPNLPTLTLALNALPPEDQRRMLSLLFPEGLAQRTADFLLAESAGNPFILQEMARAIREGWRILEDPISGALRFEDVKGASVPPGAQSFLETRVDTLPSALRTALKDLSVIGLEFGLEDAKELLGRQADSLLEQLVGRHFLRKTSLDRYEFVHARIREVAYQRMDEKTRIKLHRRWARHLEKERSDEPALIGQHLEQAGVKDAAAARYFEAGDLIAKKDFQSAAKLYRHAYDLAEGRPRERFRYLRALDNVLYLSGQNKEELELYELAAPLLKDLPPIDHAGHRYRRGRALIRLGRYDEAMSSLEEALQIAETLAVHDPGLEKLKGHILVDLAITKTFRGEMDVSEDLNRRAEQIGRATEDRLVIARALWAISHRESRRGHPDAALRAVREANALFYALGESLRYVMTLMNLGWNELALGALSDAEATLRRALFMAQRRFQGRVQAMESLYDSLGRVLSLLGKHDEAVAILKRNLSENPDHPFLAYNHVYLAQAQLQRGDPAAAREAAEAALRAALSKKEDPSKATEGEAAARMALAQVLLAEGDAPRALEESEAAMDLLKRLGGVETFGLEIPYTHGRILHRLGRLPEARAALEAAHRLLEKNAAKIAEEPLRIRYLEGVAVHRDLGRLLQEAASEPGTT